MRYKYTMGINDNEKRHFMIVVLSYRYKHRLQLGRICSRHHSFEVFSSTKNMYSFMRRNKVGIVILAGLPFFEYQSIIAKIRGENFMFREILVFEEFVTISKPQMTDWDIRGYLGSPKKVQEIEDWIENAIRGNYKIIQNTL